MKKAVLLYLEQEPRKVGAAVRAVMKGEEFCQLPDAAQTHKLARQKKPDGVVFVASQEADWSVLGTHGDPLDLELASAIAGESSGTGWVRESSGRGKVAMWAINDGVRAAEPQLMTEDKALSYLRTAGVNERLLNFNAKDHLDRESTKLGKHVDALFGFTRVPADDAADQNTKKTGEQEVREALADKKVTEKTLTLERFLDRAVKHKGVRAIARAQIEEQLKSEGFGGLLAITNPVPEGHFCEAFNAESYSFTSNGPYVWFDWFCEEACEPELAAEKAFPACDLKFRLQRSDEL